MGHAHEPAGRVIDLAGIIRDDIKAFDFPVTGLCSCGELIRKAGPGQPWRLLPIDPNLTAEAIARAIHTQDPPEEAQP